MIDTARGRSAQLGRNSYVRRIGWAGAEQGPMPHLRHHGPASGPLAGRRAATIEPEQFERHLLRRSVGILAGDRATCTDCGRTPLVGEELHLFEGDQPVCELCRPLRRGQPVSTVMVRHSEYGHTVRVSRTP